MNKENNRLLRTGRAIVAAGAVAAGTVGALELQPTFSPDRQAQQSGHVLNVQNPADAFATAMKAAGIQTGAEKVLADDNRPPILERRDGRKYASVTFQPGMAFIVNSDNGLRLSQGLAYPGKVSIVVVSNAQSTINFEFEELACGGGISVDLLGYVKGNDYPTRAASAMQGLDEKMGGKTNRQRLERREIGLLFDTDRLGRIAPPELISDSGDLGTPMPAANCEPEAPAKAPVTTGALAAAPIGITPRDCVMEVPLGTASGNGAVVNEVTVIQEVILHGDGIINGEFTADDSGATGQIRRVHATPANPARIQVGNPAWGLDVAAFCDPKDMAANIAQGVANLQSKGLRADVLDWPGPKQGVAASSFVPGAAVSAAGIDARIAALSDQTLVQSCKPITRAGETATLISAGYPGADDANPWTPGRIDTEYASLVCANPNSAPATAGAAESIRSSQINAGQKVRLPKYSLVVGEGRINGEKRFDDKGDTGVVFVLETEADVEGGNDYSVGTVQGFSSLESARQAAFKISEGMKKDGCGSVCRVADVLNYPSGSKQQ